MCQFYLPGCRRCLFFQLIYGNLWRVFHRRGGSEISPFCAACWPGIVIYPVSSEVSSSVLPDGTAFVLRLHILHWRGMPSTIMVCGLITSVTIPSWNLDVHR